MRPALSAMQKSKLKNLHANGISAINDRFEAILRTEYESRAHVVEDIADLATAIMALASTLKRIQGEIEAAPLSSES